MASQEANPLLLVLDELRAIRMVLSIHGILLGAIAVAVGAKVILS